MRQLRRNREEERELMKNVKGWEVGKYFNEPVYYTLPEDEIEDPILSEYYAHTRLKYLSELFHFEQRH